MDSFKDHMGSVCLVNVINPSNKPVVDNQVAHSHLIECSVVVGVLLKTTRDSKLKKNSGELIQGQP